MLLTTGVLLLTAVLDILLGCVVALCNPGRRQNRQFTVFSLVLGIWTLLILMAITRRDLAMAAYWIRVSCVFATGIPLAFFLLGSSIAQPAERIATTLRRFWPLPLGALAASLMAMSPAFLRGAIQPDVAATTSLVFPEPQYGPLFMPYNLYFLVAFGWTLYSFIRTLVSTKGVQRTEVQFVLLGMLLTMLFSLTTQIFIPMLTGSAQTQPFGPVGVLAMNATIAYGIATRRIMDAAVMLRRAIAYGLLTAYLVIVFFLTHLAIGQLTTVSARSQQIAASFAAAVLVALSMAPAQAYMKRVADWLFASSRNVRLAGAVESVTTSLQSVSTMPELISSFVETILALTGAQHVVMLLERKRNFEQVHPVGGPEGRGQVIAEQDSIPAMLRARGEPVVADELMRERQTEEIRALRAAMHDANAAVAIGIRSRGRLVGLLLLGVRTSGRIYGREDQHNLQILCNHLGVAVENARLYTESVEHRLHSVTLLNNLVNGVVATDGEGEITMINREAQRLCRLPPPGDRPLRLDDLSAPLADALRRTLQQGAGERDLDAEIPQPNAPPMPIRLGTSPFHNAEGQIMGALAVLSDQTTVRKLEAQIRRTDRLASVGTLAAGMAHEIKNPLVTINTFTQLLPERYADADFRTTFTDLMQHEVQRMNSLVNQLLRFARPSPPLLAPLRLAGVVEHCLLLMEQQIRNHRVQLEKQMRAPEAMIRADANQMEQAIVNFVLNALQSMAPEGRLLVGLRRIESPQARRTWRHTTPAAIELRIQDSGCGIAPENLNSIFDPFFTTRSEGTGLGLSVAHGIIVEHSGAVEVESTVGVGTTFTITFPALEQEAPA